MWRRPDLNCIYWLVLSLLPKFHFHYQNANQRENKAWISGLYPKFFVQSLLFRLVKLTCYGFLNNITIIIETNSENWVFHFCTFWTRFQGLIANSLYIYIYIYIKSWIVNGLSKIYDAMKFEYWAILFYFIFDWFQVEWFISFYFQVWLYFEASEILIENMRCYWVLGFWLQVLRVWISCLSENSSLRIVIE